MFLLQFSNIALILALAVFSLTASAEDYLTEAKQYISKGEYRAATIQLKNQLKENPEDAQARYLLGTLYLQQSEIKAALKELGKAHKLQADNISYTLSYSKALLLSRDYQQLKKLLNFSTTGDNENLRQVYLGYTNLALTQIEEAKKNFNFAIKNNFIEGYTGMAKIAIMQKDFKQAEENIKYVLSKQENDLEALQIYAKVLNLTQRYKQALEVYNQLIAKNSTNENYYLQRASTFLALKEYKQANNDVDKILKTNKDQAFANYLLAQIKLKQKDYAASRDAAQIVLNQSPHHYPTKLILGISNYALGNLNQADKFLTEYLSSQPDNLAIKDLLANVYLAQKNPQQAVLMLEGLDQETLDKYPNINTTLGSAYLLMGEHQKGIEFLNKAKALDPDNMTVQKRLIAGQLKSGDRESGIAGLERVAKLEPDNKKVNYLLMISYIQDKKLDIAENKLEKMIQTSSDDPVLYNFRSVIESIKGNTEKAKQAYHKALEVDKNFVPAYMGLAKFAYSEGKEQEAVNYFKQVTQIKPQYLASYLALASIAEKNKQNKQAEQYLQTAFDNNKDNLAVQLKVSSLLGKWYAKFKQPEKVLLLAQELIKQHPQDLSALSYLAGAQMINGKNILAEKTLDDIVRGNPKDIKHRILLANLIAKQAGRELEVLKLLEQVYNNDSSKPQGLSFQVNYLIKQKKYPQAMEIAKRIDSLFPDLASGKKLQGDIFWVQQQRDKAISLYRQAYQKQPGVKALFFLSELMIKDGKSDLALQFLKEELANTPLEDNKHKAILLKLASTYQQLKEDDKAIGYYKKIVDIQADNALALNNLAWIYYTKKDPKAEIMAERAYKKAPDSAQVADTYAVILLDIAGQGARALKILQDASKKSPNDYDIQFHLARAYEMTGDKQNAIKILHLITASEKIFSEKQAAVALLNKLK